MQEFRFDNLSNIRLDEMLECFNEAFKNYFVPFHLSEQQLKDKIKAEAIDLNLSFGAFADGKLVAFILHGIDVLNNRKTAFNAGTGVLPDYRGAGLTFTLYEYALEILRQNGVQYSLLEVFEQNHPAIKTYEKAGFKKDRVILSFKGKPEGKNYPHIKFEDPLPFNEISHLPNCDWEPTWQNNIQSISRIGDQYMTYTAVNENGDMGSCIVNKNSGRITQICSNKNAVDLLPALIGRVAKDFSGPLSIIHVDENAGHIISGLQNCGFEHLITSYEMSREL